MPRLLAARGTGSAIIEAAYALAGAALTIEPTEIYEQAEARARARLHKLNPLGQVPVLVLDDGTVLTESAAMVLLAAEQPGGAVLAPAPDDPQRASFLNWLVFLVGALYPTFTYGDEPSRYVPGDAGTALRNITDAKREAMWRQVEAAAAGPWFLGTQRSAIDIYVWVMVHWRPRRAWFRAETPRLSAIADALDAEPLLAGVKARNGWH